jgi:hypothetical protein
MRRKKSKKKELSPSLFLLLLREAAQVPEG